MRTILTVLTALLPLGAWAQTVTMPQTVPVSTGRLAVVDMTYDGDDFKYTVPPELDAFREYTTDPKHVRLRVLGYQAGIFRIQAVTCKGGKLSEFGSTAVIVGGVPVPPPIPPGPIPPDPPVPPTPVVGQKGVVIIRETAESTPAMARLVTSLWTGLPSQYIRDKKHKLEILDDDSVGSDGKPTPAVEAWRPVFSGMALPVLVIYDLRTRNVLSREPLPATGEAVVEAIKKAGG